MLADHAVPPVHFIPQLRVVHRQVAEFNRAGRAVRRRRLRVDHFDDLLVHEAVVVGDARDRRAVVRATRVEHRVVRCRSVARVHLDVRRSPRSRRTGRRYDRAGQVLRAVRHRVRVRVRYIHARKVRVVRAPVDDRPRPLDLEACVRYDREHFVFERYTQQFAVFAEERRLTVVTRTVAYRHDHVVREAHEVVLFVVHKHALRALAREAVAVVSAERARDRTPVAHRVEQRVVGAVLQTALALIYFRRVEAAVVGNRCFAVGPQARVEVLARYRRVRRRQTSRFDLVLYFHLDHALVGHRFAVGLVHDIAVAVQLVHRQDHRLRRTDFVAVELDRVTFRGGYFVFVAAAVRLVVQVFNAIRVRRHPLDRQLERTAVVFRARVERRGRHPGHTRAFAAVGGRVAVERIVNIDRYCREFLAVGRRRRQIAHRQVECAGRVVAAVVRHRVRHAVRTDRQTGRRVAKHTQRVARPVVVAREVRQRTAIRVRVQHRAGFGVVRHHLRRDMVDPRAVVRDDDIRKVHRRAAVERIGTHRQVRRAGETRARLIQHLDYLKVILRIGGRRERRGRQTPVHYCPGPKNLVRSVADRDDLVGVHHTQFAPGRVRVQINVQVAKRYIRRSCHCRVRVAVGAIHRHIRGELYVVHVQALEVDVLRARCRVVRSIGGDPNPLHVGRKIVRIAAIGVVPGIRVGQRVRPAVLVNRGIRGIRQHQHIVQVGRVVLRDGAVQIDVFTSQYRRKFVFHFDIAPALVAAHQVRHPHLIGFTQIRSIDKTGHPRTVAVRDRFVQFNDIVVITAITAFQDHIRVDLCFAVFIHRNNHQVVADQRGRRGDHLNVGFDRLYAARVVRTGGLGHTAIDRVHDLVLAGALARIKSAGRNPIDRERGRRDVRITRVARQIHRIGKGTEVARQVGSDRGIGVLAAVANRQGCTQAVGHRDAVAQGVDVAAFQLEHVAADIAQHRAHRNRRGRRGRRQAGRRVQTRDRRDRPGLRARRVHLDCLAKLTIGQGRGVVQAGTKIEDFNRTIERRNRHRTRHIGRTAADAGSDNRVGAADRESTEVDRAARTSYRGAVVDAVDL